MESGGWSGTRKALDEARWMAATAGGTAAAGARRAAFARGVETFAQADRALAVTSEIWDRDPWLLGTPSGTADLRNGALRGARSEDYISRSTSVAPSDDAACPMWICFLEDIFAGDTAVIRFVQQFAGYCLTGSTREHALVFGVGPGGNGKSVFVNVIAGAMGDYAGVAAMDAFTASRNDKHPADLAALRGKRLVTASETEADRAWAESRMKQITGGEPITARFMGCNFFTYLPQFKLLIVGNHKPALHNLDDAARRRINILPFDFRPPTPDLNLEEKLRAEWPGILRWMIAGALDWQANGLIRPDTVVAATASYFEDQDLFSQWLAECCDTRPGDRALREQSGVLMASWRRQAEANGHPVGSSVSFAEQMARRGFTAHKGAKGVRCYLGVRLKPVGGWPEVRWPETQGGQSGRVAGGGG